MTPGRDQTVELLHALGRDHARNWQRYLDALAGAGASRNA